MSAPAALRPATGDDVDALFDIHRALFRAHIDELWGWDEAWQRDRFARDAAASETSVVEVGGRTAGYVQVDRGEGRWHLRSMALLPEAQGRGLGTELVRGLQDEAAGRGVRLTLVVFRTNPRARAFYERLGFRETGRTEAVVEMAWVPD